MMTTTKWYVQIGKIRARDERDVHPNIDRPACGVHGLMACRIAFLLFFVISGHAAWAGNWYVNKAATGAGNGTNWTNAWKDFNNISFSSVACGDTIWVAGGTYKGSLVFNKTCTAGNPLTIRRVLSSDSVPVSAPGWNSAYDSQVVNNAGSITFRGAYLTLDGRIGDTGLRNSGVPIPYGMKWNYTSSTGLTAITTTGSPTGITMTYIEFNGPPCARTFKSGTSDTPQGTCTGSTWGYSPNPSGTDTGTTMDHVYIHSFSEIIRPAQTIGMTIRYSYIGEDVYMTSADHEDLIYAWGDMHNFTAYNNVWYSSGNDGIFIDFDTNSSNFVFYNNLFVGWGAWAISFGKSGTCGPFFMFNNSFINDSLGSDGAGNEWPWGTIDSGGCAISSSSLFQNNILYNATQGFTDSEATYNAGTVSNGYSFSCGTGCFQYTQATPIQSYTGFNNMSPRTGTNPALIDLTQLDLHLSASGQTTFGGKGMNLTSLCLTYTALCLDFDGNPRPTSGPWDLGAFQQH